MSGQPQGGLMVLDISRPSARSSSGTPFDAKPGESSRELRVWRSKNVLIVLNTNCGVGPTLHHCTQPSISNFRFYDIAGATPRSRSSSASSTSTPTSSSSGRTRRTPTER